MSIELHPSSWLATAVDTRWGRGVGAVLVGRAVAARRQAGLLQLRWRRRRRRVGQADPPGDREALLSRRWVLLGVREIQLLLTVGGWSIRIVHRKAFTSESSVYSMSSG